MRELPSIGLSAEEVNRQAGLYPGEYIREHLALARKRLTSKAQRTLDNPAGWQLTALAGNYVGAKRAADEARRAAREAKKQRDALQSPAPAQAARMQQQLQLPVPNHLIGKGGAAGERAPAADALPEPEDAALAWFTAQAQKTRQMLTAEFHNAAPVIIHATLRTNPKSPVVVRHALVEWLRVHAMLSSPPSAGQGTPTCLGLSIDFSGQHWSQSRRPQQAACRCEQSGREVECDHAKGSYSVHRRRVQAEASPGVPRLHCCSCGEPPRRRRSQVPALGEGVRAPASATARRCPGSGTRRRQSPRPIDCRDTAPVLSSQARLDRPRSEHIARLLTLGKVRATEVYAG